MLALYKLQLAERAIVAYKSHKTYFIIRNIMLILSGSLPGLGHTRVTACDVLG